MKCHFEKQLHRRSIRLKDYDYSQEGAYFVTICAYGKKCIFGDVISTTGLNYHQLARSYPNFGLKYQNILGAFI